jgi:hypothetical protein
MVYGPSKPCIIGIIYMSPFGAAGIAYVFGDPHRLGLARPCDAPRHPNLLESLVALVSSYIQRHGRTKIASHVGLAE